MEPELKIKKVATDTPQSEKTALESLAEIVDAHFKASHATFMLSAPCNVTVLKKDETYSKRPMLGGEQFSPVKCYPGKRKSLIFVFKPEQASDFSFIEMPERDAKMYLGKSFSSYLDRAGDGRGKDMFEEAKKSESAAAEAKKNEEKFETYSGIGFGSW